MSTDLTDLLSFLHHGNTQIRQVACSHLVGYSSNPSIFKQHQFIPITDLKLLVRDYKPIAKDALTILINLSGDKEIMENLATDDAFLETLLKKITNPKDSLSGDCSTLLSNLSTHDSVSRLLTLKRGVPKSGVSKSNMALDQLLDCFIYTPTPPSTKPPSTTNGDHSPTRNSDSTDPYAYLSYLFANLTQHPSIQTYFLTPQPYDTLHPTTKLLPFTTHPSSIRRRGITSTIKNISFSLPSHPMLLSPIEINILPSLLLPLAGPEQLPLDETEQLLEELQLLPPDKKRESEEEILITLVETVLLLTTTRKGRERLRGAGTYVVIRECHAAVESEGVREVCERVVDVLMRDEAEEEVVEVNEDSKIEEIF